MLNHSFTIDMAKALAERTGDSAGASAEEQVKFVFQIAYQRDPDAEEHAAGMAAVSNLGLEAFCRALLNSSELIYLD
jgi:hypothetical protein